MQGGMTGSMPAAHKPTMGYTVAIVIGLFVIYHVVTKRK